MKYIYRTFLDNWTNIPNFDIEIDSKDYGHDKAEHRSKCESIVRYILPDYKLTDPVQHNEIYLKKVIVEENN